MTSPAASPAADRNRPPAARQGFASDNTAGICPDAWAALEAANRDRLPSYGNDAWTARACDLLRAVFETDCDVYFVFNGTAANSLALASLCQSYHSVICHDYAHVETDECGAPEFFSNGTKILVATGANGKLDPREVERVICRRTDIHGLPECAGVASGLDATGPEWRNHRGLDHHERHRQLRQYAERVRFLDYRCRLG